MSWADDNYYDNWVDYALEDISYSEAVIMKREYKNQKLCWETKEGKDIGVQELSDSHLANIHKFLTRGLESTEKVIYFDTWLNIISAEIKRRNEPITLIEF